MDNSQKKLNLSKEQRTGFVLLLVFAVLVIVLGLLQIRNTIYNPFAINFLVYDEEAVIHDTEGRLKSIDTDGDGLSDWDELYVYKTSPYLADTDSDGINDKDELDKGMNPLCNEKSGECVGWDEESGMNSTSTINEIGASPLLDFSTNVYDIGEDAGIFANEQTGNNAYTEALLKPDSLRALLLMTGEISEEELNKIDDETLINLSKNLLQQDISVLGTTTASNFQ
ncbi:MAG TPA: hypothetical protein PLX01_03040 [Candidatus Magasanikbacteria bacterium]|jgi:hypothetical protein|nr:hypothetical protein [Candidatus Magasanikbacteria bacterium]